MIQFRDTTDYESSNFYGSDQQCSVSIQLAHGMVVSASMELEEFVRTREIGSLSHEEIQAHIRRYAGYGVSVKRTRDIWDSVIGLERSTAANWLQVMSSPLDQVFVF